MREGGKGGGRGEREKNKIEAEEVKANRGIKGREEKTKERL